MSNILAFFTGGFGPMEMVAIGAVGLLVFGNKLPSVGRSLGKSLVEFKKGIKGVKDEIEDAESEAESMSDPKESTSATEE